MMMILCFVLSSGVFGTSSQEPLLLLGNGGVFGLHARG